MQAWWARPAEHWGPGERLLGCGVCQGCYQGFQGTCPPVAGGPGWHAGVVGAPGRALGPGRAAAGVRCLSGLLSGFSGYVPACRRRARQAWRHGGRARQSTGAQASGCWRAAPPRWPTCARPCGRSSATAAPRVRGAAVRWVSHSSHENGMCTGLASCYRLVRVQSVLLGMNMVHQVWYMFVVSDYTTAVLQFTPVPGKSLLMRRARFDAYPALL